MAFFTSNLTIVGNLTDDPELRFTPGGKSVASFSIAVNDRKKVSDIEWEDDPSFIEVVVWEKLAENCAESLTKGMRVIVTGRMKQQRWETPDGDKRSKHILQVECIGPDLTWATAQVTRVAGAGGGRGPSAAELAAQQAGGRPQQQRPAQQPARSGYGDPGPTYDYDEEPF